MSNQNISVTISGQAPNFQVTLSPAGPYTISQSDSSLTMRLDNASASSGFQIVGIGFDGRDHDQSTGPAESQLTATISSSDHPNDTMVIVDHDSESGQFEFIFLYKDSSGIIYGLDPEILNDIP